MSSKKVILSKGYKNSLRLYFRYKTKTNELIHAIKKVDIIEKKLIEIANEIYPLSKKVNYGNSKGLNYITVDKHIIMFKVKPKSITAMYFKASARIKQPIFKEDAQKKSVKRRKN